MEKQGLGKKFNSRYNLLATFVMRKLFHYNAKASTMFLVDSLSELGSLSLITLIRGKGWKIPFIYLHCCYTAATLLLICDKM